MSETDNPLKMLITDFGPVFAAWLLGRPVRWARPLNVEFPAHPIQSDLLFAVEDEQGQLFLLHYEFQGRTSHRPMPYRQLEYMSQVAIREIPWSIVVCEGVMPPISANNSAAVRGGKWAVTQLICRAARGVT
ncbi:MAG: hypothetical protein HS099_03405 [Ardenticatenaceae bacterium]|nr:hypothetical protein [Ardenticatenaceae bacterium]